MTPLSRLAYYHRVTRPSRRFAAFLLALFAIAVAAAFFVHDSHDRACAESCHVCHFSRAAHGADLTVAAEIDFTAITEPLFNFESQSFQASSRSIPSARAPPAA